VRGLSAVFWGLPFALLFCAKTAMGDDWRPYGLTDLLLSARRTIWRVSLETLLHSLPAIAALGLVYHGLRELRHFQSQERIWATALERAKLLALVNLTLAPVTFWWSRAPEEPFFSQSMVVLVFTALAFVLALNRVLLRLSAMLPDETLRVETRFFVSVNRQLLFLLGLILACGVILARWPHGPQALLLLRAAVDDARPILLIVLALLPLALTMTLLWKTKEVIVASVFREPKF
jgi:hypothetical protein